MRMMFALQAVAVISISSKSFDLCVGFRAMPIL